MDRKRIMIVEDSPTQGLKLKMALEEEGFEATCVETAEEALESLNTLRPDLIVADYHLPGIQGDDLCRRIRMNINTQSIPILMLTMDQDVAAELHGLESGADDYVSKSEDLDILMLRIHNLLRKSGWQASIIKPEGSFFRKARILIIDDSQTYVDFLEAELTDEGYEVTSSLSGSNGIAIAGNGGFDCVLLDLVMPDMDGIEVCRHLSARRETKTSSIVVLMISAHETKESVMRALEAGADDFVGKSVDISVLKGRIRALLRQKFLNEQSQKILDKFKQREDDLERLVEKRTRELKRAEKDAREAKDQAESANLAKTHFLAHMSHELRTPLNAIIGFSDMIRNQVNGPLENEKYREYIENIYDSGHYLHEIIHDILDVSGIEVGRVNVHEEEVRIDKVIASAWRIVKQPAERGKLRLTVDVDKKLPSLYVDERLLKQILLNLLSNAVKFTPVGGRVTIAAGIEDNGGMAISITDTGIGIPPEMIEKALEPFGQVDSSLARKHAGTGLGLPLSKAFVELHEGVFELKSKVGKGTTVTMYFPSERVR